LIIEGPDWSYDHTLQLFDPSLGDLLGANLTIGLELTNRSSAMLEYVDLSDIKAAVSGETIPDPAANRPGGTVPGNSISATTASTESQVWVTYSCEPEFSEERGV